MKQEKVVILGVFSVAGNGNSGNVIAFRLSEPQLENKIKEFREEYGEGQHGMVTWARFCAFLGYSEEQVIECYQKGKEGKNAYTGRADLLEKFHTECKALTNETCDKKQNLAKKETDENHLAPKQADGQNNAVKVYNYFGAKGDDRSVEAMK